MTPPPTASRHTTPEAQARVAKRQAAEKRFQLYGIVAIILALVFLVMLFGSIIGKGYTAFQQTYLKLDVFIDQDLIGAEDANDTEALATGNYQAVVKKSMRDFFPEVRGRRDKRKLYGLVSGGAAFELRDMVVNDTSLLGTAITIWVPASDDDPPRPVHSTDEVPGSFEHEPWRGGDFILRLQPELLRGGQYRVVLRLEAQLAFPVEGHGIQSVQSPFGVARDGGRRSHHGVDIFARRGTPVLAASSGRVNLRMKPRANTVLPLPKSPISPIASPGTATAATASAIATVAAPLPPG